MLIPIAVACRAEIIAIERPLRVFADIYMVYSHWREACVSQEEESVFRARATVMHDRSDIADRSCKSAKKSCSQIEVVEKFYTVRLALPPKCVSRTIDE